VRAGRLISLVLILQTRGRTTAARLADELEVSERTILRDIEALGGAGVPIYATRGVGGGFQLLDGYTSNLGEATSGRARHRRPQHGERATALISPEGRRTAALLGRLQPMRVRRNVGPEADGRQPVTFRIDSIEAAVIDVLSLGPSVEVVAPAALRESVIDAVRRMAALYRSS
jgi:predicted DNA-binding transcriptional regulator YafY